MMPITLATLAQHTPQQVFDYITQSLLKQNDKSTDNKGNCRYRGVGGLKCAAGFIIADEEYNTDLEERPWSILSTFGTVPREHNRLISALQLVHDSADCNEWDTKFRIIAEAHNLKYTNKE